MKKKVLILSLAVIALAVLATGTLAFFTYEDTAHNVITSGGVTIEVIEKMKGEGDTLVDFPEEGIPGVMPGTSVSKIVSVKNTGLSEAWIRVSVEQAITGADKQPLPGVIRENIPVMSFTVDGDLWIEEAGYYYYTKAVPAGESTEVLFREVVFAPQMGNEYQGCTANIIVYAQAVQAANNAIPEGGDVTDVKGWPEKEVADE